jgi:hypothetical protein
MPHTFASHTSCATSACQRAPRQLCSHAAKLPACRWMARCTRRGVPGAYLETATATVPESRLLPSRGRNPGCRTPEQRQTGRGCTRGVAALQDARDGGRLVDRVVLEAHQQREGRAVARRDQRTALRRRGHKLALPVADLPGRHTLAQAPQRAPHHARPAPPGALIARPRLAAQAASSRAGNQGGQGRGHHGHRHWRRRAWCKAGRCIKLKTHAYLHEIVLRWA